VVANELSIFNFNKLRKAVNLYIIAVEDAERIAIFLKETHKMSKLYKNCNNREINPTREAKRDFLILLFLEYIERVSLV